MKIVSIVGARPQFVKAAPLSRELRREHREVLVHTGQHYDRELSQVFFEQLDLPQPDYHLGVGSASHGQQTAGILARAEEVLLKEAPDLVLVFGDTNSTLGGALAAAKIPLPVAHVEAGLRSYDRRMPEEVNRVLTDHLSTLLLCPTASAVANLAREGITQGVHAVGDVMVDALQQSLPQVRQNGALLERLGVEPGAYLLVTVHRAENTDNPHRLSAILQGLGQAEERTILPAHPRTRQAIQKWGCPLPPHLRLIDPVGYLDMLTLEQHARLILTDSGGVQKEAYLLGVPCLTLRDRTEWVETVEAGWNCLVGTDPGAIARGVQGFHATGPRPAFLGDGHASRRIGEVIAAWARNHL